MIPIKLGIIGGGQLGKMLIEEAYKWNIEVFFLDNNPTCPASIINKNQIIGSLQDAEKIKELADKVDVLTYEIEHINSIILLELEAQGKRIIPSPKVLHTIQDKGLQKEFYKTNQLPTASFFVCNNAIEIKNAIENTKSERIVFKACKGGYDGKGVEILDKNAIDYTELPFDGKQVLIEECIEFEKELAIIVARSQQGETIAYPCFEMEFNPKNNLVQVVYCPSFVAVEIQNEAKRIACETIEKLDGIGIFAVEFLLDNNQKLYINEIAPRPHNSGHASIEGNFTSQYEQLIRVLLNAPLGSTNSIYPSAMINIVGTNDVNGTYEIHGLDELLKMEGVYVHLYGKTTTSPNRKLGHITLIEANFNQLKIKANAIEKKFQIVAKP
jgi:5-(carboxyamino)imidazole ribonucleotide synthase